jgi:hypothetical protein
LPKDIFIFLGRVKEIMDLTAKVGIVVIVLIMLIAIIFLLKSMQGPQPTESQAVSLVMKDLNSTFPNARISIVNVTNSTYYTSTNHPEKNWVVVVSIVKNATRACPALSIESFSYPATVLFPTVINNYTDLNCTISSMSNAPSYVIDSPYVAQAKPYISKYLPVVNYINDYGYSNTIVSAKYMPLISLKNITGSNATYENSWLVVYNATNAHTSLFVIMNETGGIAYSFNESK